MRVVVTGANGFVGYHTVNELLKQGFNVLAIDLADNKLRASEAWMNPNLQFHKTDILDSNLKNLLKQNDTVLHLAAVAHRHDVDVDPMTGYRINVLGTLQVILSCVASKVRRLIYSSTGSVYSKNVQIPIRENEPREPHCLYGLSKKMAEDLVILHGNELNYIILRYGYVFGPMKGRGAIYNFLTKLAEGEKPVIYGGTQTEDFVYVRDVVQANILACESPYNNMIYNIGSGKPINIKEAAEECMRALNMEGEVEVKPMRWMDYPAFVYDISKAGTLLRYTPEYSLHTGVAEMVNGIKVPIAKTV
jgi:UDP-glucose 4-epimerase